MVTSCVYMLKRLSDTNTFASAPVSLTIVISNNGKLTINNLNIADGGKMVDAGGAIQFADVALISSPLPAITPPWST